MKADEEIGLVVVGDRRALVEADRPVGVARQQRADAEPALDRRLQTPRDGERDVFLQRSAGTLRAPARRRHAPGRSRWCAAGRSARTAAGAAARPAAARFRRSSLRRRRDRSRAARRRVLEGTSLDLNDPNFGPRSMTITAGPSPWRIADTRSRPTVTGSCVSSASASKRTTRRPVSCETGWALPAECRR